MPQHFMFTGTGATKGATAPPPPEANVGYPPGCGDGAGAAPRLDRGLQHPGAALGPGDAEPGRVSDGAAHAKLLAVSSPLGSTPRSSSDRFAMSRIRSTGRGKVLLRKPRKTDIPALVRIERRAFAPRYYRHHRLTASDFADLMKQRHFVFLVAEDRGHVVGNVIGELPRDRMRRFARLDSIAVRPERQHRGLGRHLATRFLARAKNAGYRGAVLEVAVLNISARHLFERLGFHKNRTLPRYYGGRVDALRLVRRFK